MKLDNCSGLNFNLTRESRAFHVTPLFDLKQCESTFLCQKEQKIPRMTQLLAKNEV